MFVRMTTLQHWKSDHDVLSCEDAVQADLAQGLFALADGAGTTLFSNVWARVLVAFFLQVPLLSNDAFEVEWWIRQAQKRYQQEVPPLPASSWNARQKAREQGSYATLATLRVLRNNEQSTDLECLTIGDTCLLIRKAGKRSLQTFPYTRPEEFDAAPVCFPSLVVLFDRTFHHCLLQSYTFAPGDQAILATDAVARWIMSAGKDSYADAGEAFQAIAEQTPGSWPIFIKDCRMKRGMMDDDSTALLLSFTAEADQDAQEPGIVSGHSLETRSLRKQAFEQAQQEQNKELQAIMYGDGVDLALEGISLSSPEREEMRQVADAFHAVLAELRRTLNHTDMVSSMKRIWARYVPLLDTEPCAANLRQTLVQHGVLPLSPAPQSVLTAYPDQVSLSALSPAHPDTLPSAQEPEQVGDQQIIQASLASKSIEQMALAYTRLPENATFLSPAEQERLKLAYHFKVAFDARFDDQLFGIYTQILESGHLPYFNLNGHENERIAIIGHLKETQRLEEEWASSSQARAGTLSTEWVEKVSLVKHFYLLYKERPVPLNQLEQLALEDLNNAPAIQSGIQEINNHYKRKVLDSEGVLKKDVKNFRKVRRKDYDFLIYRYHITEEEIKSIVAIFVRTQILEDYLQRTHHLSLLDWLKQRTRPPAAHENYSGAGEKSI
ncbi:MAG: protein phosphatase 2C domain-containing protein [Ktedonobacteraceae bacterium]